MSESPKVFAFLLLCQCVVLNESPHPLRPNTPPNDLCSFFLIFRNPSVKQTPSDMKDVVLLQSNLSPNMEALHYPGVTGQSLENQILTQASSFVLQPPLWANLTSSCPALCPSSLSSTTSSSPLLSTFSSLLSSPLLSTENTQLKCSSLHVSSLCSSEPLTALIHSTAPPTGAVEVSKCISREHGAIRAEEDESCFSDDLLSYSNEINEVLFPL